MLRENAAAAVERCAVGHHLEEKVLSTLTDCGHVLQINDDGSRSVCALGLCPTPLQFGNPRVDQSAFQDQRPPVLVIDGCDLQHCVPAGREGTGNAIVGTLTCNAEAMQNHELADAWTSKRGRSVELDVEKLRRMTMSVVS